MVVVELACDKCRYQFLRVIFFNISKIKEGGFFNTIDMIVADEVSINRDTMICSKFCRTEREEL